MPPRRAAAAGICSDFDARPVKDAEFPPIDGKRLRVFPEDADLPKDAINATADEVFVPKAEAIAAAHRWRY